MTGPGGDEVARVSVRVVPNTDDFKRDLERQLREIRDAEITIPVKLDIDKANLERQLQDIRDEDLKIPVNFDVENVQDDIDRATRGARANKVTVPVEIDDSTLNESVRLIPIDPVHAQLLLDEDRLNAELAEVNAKLDELDDRPVTPHVTLLYAALGAQLADITSQLDAVRKRRLAIPVDLDLDNFKTSIGNVDRKLDPVQVPLEANSAEFSATLRQALADGEIVANRPILFKIEADREALDREIAEVETEIQRLRNQGVELEFRARTEGIELAINKVRGELEQLSHVEASPKIQLAINENLDELARLEAALAGLSRDEISIEVKAKIQQAMAELVELVGVAATLEDKHLKILADLDVDDESAAADLTLFRARQRANAINIPVNIDIDRARLDLVTSGFVGRFTGAFEAVYAAVARVGNSVSSVFSKLGSWVDPLGETNNSLIAMGSRLGTVLGIATQVVGPLVQFSALATGITLAGAAITAAWGGVAAALGTIPGLIAAVGVPVGVVALGMDGIKKAAEALNPAFTRLKESVSATFEKTMTPAMKQLATLFPKITFEVNQVARAISLVATDLTQWVTSAQGVARVEEILRRVSQAINDMRPGILDTITTFTLLASQASVFNVLTGAVNEFGRAFREAVLTSIGDGSFDAAMRGLQGTLEALTRGFVSLVQNGISVFAAAAPGINHSLDSLTNFFNRFDWERLGAAVGAVFDGLASALDRVPQGTIDAIAAGFERLGQTFQTAGFQQALLDVINAIPTLLGGLQAGVEGLARFAQAFVGTIDIVRGFVNNFGVVWDLLEGEISWEDADRKIHEGQALIENGLGTVLKSVQDWGPQVGSAMQNSMATVPASANAAMTELKAKIAAGVVDAKTAIPAGFEGVGTATATALAPVVPAATGAVANVGTAVSGEMAKVPPAADAALAPIQQLDALRGMRDQFTLAAADSMHAMSVGVQSGMAEVQQQFKTGLDTASSGVNSSFTLIGQGFTIGMAGLAATVAAGMPAIQAAFNFELVGQGIGLAFLGMVGTFNLGMASLAATVTAGMPLIAAAFNFTTISQGVGLAFLGLVGTVNLGMLSVVSAVTTGMTQVAAAFNFQLIGASVGLSFLNLVGTVTLGMASLVVAVQTGMASIALAFNFAPVQAAVGLAFQGMVGTVNLGMAGLAATVTAGMGQIAAAFNFAPVQAAVGVAFLGLIGTIRLGMAGLAAEATAGMNGVVTAITAGMQRAVAAVTAAGAQISSAGQVSMAGFGAAIQAGMNTAVATVVAGAARITTSVVQMGQQIITSITTAMNQFQSAVVSGMNASTAAVTSGVARMVAALRAGSSQFQAIGVQMMQGLRAGILSQAGSIAAAAAQVVSQAVAAARAAAQVRSPSRVFMQIGTYMGEGLALGMEKSGPRVERAADTMISSVAGIADQMTSTFSDAQWAADFGAKVENSLGDTTVDMSNRDVVGAIRRQSGDLDQSATLGSILVVLQAMYAQSKQGSGVALGAQGSRRAAELGAF